MKQTTAYSMFRGTIKKLNSIPLLLVILMSIASHIAMAQAPEDPFIRLKRLSTGEDTMKKNLPAKTITTSDPLWSAKTKSPIAFRPITPADYGRPNASPNEIVTLENGKKMTVSQLFAQLNDIERQANQHGHTLRETEEFKSATITAPSLLDGKAEQTPQPRAGLKTEAEQENFMSPVLKSGNQLLKPLGDYTPAERKRVMSNDLTNLDGTGLTVQGVSVTPGIFAAGTSTTPLKTIDETSTRDYNFGGASTFLAGVNVSLRRIAKIFGPGSKRTEFTVTGTGKAYGSVLGYNFTIMNATGTAYVPIDSSKKMSLKIVLNVAGFDLLNTNAEYAVRKVLSGEKTKSLEISRSVSVPLVWGISITGRVGVKGSAGLSYNVELDRALLKARFKPITTMDGFLEISLSVLNLASVGVRADLTFLEGYADLYGSFGIYNVNNRQIAVAYKYNVAFCVLMLKGSLKFTWKLGCFWDHCAYRGEHTFFSWAGKRICGTYADGRFIYNFYSGPARLPNDLEIK